jgi:hypothetical protein
LAEYLLLKKEKALPTLETLEVTYSSLFNADATTPIVTGIDSAL